MFDTTSPCTMLYIHIVMINQLNIENIIAINNAIVLYSIDHFVTSSYDHMTI